MGKKTVKAWLSTSDYERARNYAYVHFGKKKPETDTDYTVVPCTITYEVPKRKYKSVTAMVNDLSGQKFKKKWAKLMKRKPGKEGREGK